MVTFIVLLGYNYPLTVVSVILLIYTVFLIY